MTRYHQNELGDIARSQRCFVNISDVSEICGFDTPGGPDAIVPKLYLRDIH